jgi:hypothetical protein
MLAVIVKHLSVRQVLGIELAFPRSFGIATGSNKQVHDLFPEDTGAAERALAGRLDGLEKRMLPGISMIAGTCR